MADAVHSGEAVVLAVVALLPNQDLLRFWGIDGTDPAEVRAVLAKFGVKPEAPAI
jgi:hypothetical protein